MSDDPKENEDAEIERLRAEEELEKACVLRKIELGLAQADRGETLTHQEVKDRLRHWL